MGAKKKTKSPRKSARSSKKKAVRRCSICRKQGHNHRTCDRRPRRAKKK